MITAQDKEKSADSMICYCNSLTREDLLRHHRRCGSLAKVQDETRAGKACGGCRIILQSLFNEAPQEINAIDSGHIAGATVCLKPGLRVMKAFIVSDDKLESSIYSSNAVPPQFADCDSTMPIEYAVLDHQGGTVLHRKESLKTNETFVFDTRNEKLPKPLYGTFIYLLGRSNYGASRFNVYWSNGHSITSTHEVANSGRPNVVLPIVVDHHFLNGPNLVYLSVLNTHTMEVPYLFRMFDVEHGDEISWVSKIPAGGTRWFNVNDHFYAPALARKPTAKLSLRISTVGNDTRFPPTLYFFVHNRQTNLWSTQHL
jgi:hypothetical protein